MNPARSPARIRLPLPPFVLPLLLAVGRAIAADPVSTGYPDLEISRPSVPPDQNAATDWARAAALWESPRKEATDAFASAWNPGAWSANPAADEACLRNRAALDAVESSLSRPEAQWPKWEEGKLDPALTKLRTFQMARLYLARRSLAEGKPDECVTLLLGSVKLGQRMCEAHGALIHYAVGKAVRAQAERTVRLAAARGLLDAPHLEALARALPGLEGEPDVFAKVIRVEWTDYELPKTDIIRQAEIMTEAYRKMPEVTGILVPESLQRLHRIFWEPSLVSGHPAPFDHEKALQRMAGRYHRWLANLGRQWRDQVEDPADADAVAAKLLADSAKLLKRVEKESLPLSKKAIERVRPLYNRVEDPIGRLLASSEDLFKVGVNLPFRARAEREATRSVLAMARFRSRHGTGPGDWSALVADGLLDAVPADPFAGAPLHYSAERGVIWSVGQDGKDDGGKDDGDAEKRGQPDWTLPDAVWPVTSEIPKRRKTP